MTDAPERIGLIRGPFGGWRLWDNTSSHEEADARYIRADAPPTLTEAMRCEEVRALVTWAEAMCVFYHDDNSTHMQSLRATIANLKERGGW
jgi:hypothetical protein